MIKTDELSIGAVSVAAGDTVRSTRSDTESDVSAVAFHRVLSMVPVIFDHLHAARRGRLVAELRLHDFADIIPKRLYRCATFHPILMTIVNLCDARNCP